MASIFDWSSTAASNTAVDGININTGCAPSNLDNADRSMMSIIRQSFASALQTFFAGTAALPIANGGTAATDAATALTNLGALSSSYINLVRVDKTSNFNPDNTMRANGIAWTGAAGTLTINPNATTAIDVGATIALHNNGSGSLSITRGSGVTLKVNGSSSSADAVLAVGGVATLVKWAVDYWTVTGPGVS